MVKMAVAANLIPVTGKPLPMISYGVTSIWDEHVFLFRIILSVSTQIKSQEELESKIEKVLSEEYIEDIA